MNDRPRWFIPTLAAGLYFAQGFPFGVANYTLPLYLSVQNISATEIGLLTTIGLAWTLKVFWAPVVDLYGTYRRWISVSLIALTGLLMMLGMVPPAGMAFWIIASLLALASATQDIAIDALTIRITPRELLGPVNSARVAAYRIAIIAAGGGLAVVSDFVGWSSAFFVAAGWTLVLLFLLTFVPEGEGEAQRHQNPLRALWQWLLRPRALLLLVVIFLYRLGDSALIPMIPKYWAVRGFSASEIGTVTTTLGMLFTIAGAIAGGAFVARRGIYSALIWLGILQMLSNVGYAWVASTSATRPGLYTASSVEQFTSGLGTAAFLSFLMSICDKENAATEYAMISAIFGLSRTVAGAASGFGVDALGFAPYFWLTVALGIPGLLLLPMIRARVTPARLD